MADTASAQTGGCLCGAVRYTVSGEMVGAFHCHCSDCQKATGSGFATVAGALREQCHIEQSGEVLRDYTLKAASGLDVTRQFCSRCGSPLFTIAELNPELLWIKAGSLDKPERIEPTAACWAGNAQPWAPPVVGVPAFARNPE